MSWNELWPKQRTNARKKTISDAERQLRAKVRKNKQKAAIAASNARIASERALRAEQRRKNDKIILENERQERIRRRRGARRKGLSRLAALDNYGRLR